MKLRIITIILSTVLFILGGCDKEDSNKPPEKPVPSNGESYSCEVLRPTLSWSSSDEDLDELSFTLKFGESPNSLIEIASNLYSSKYTFDTELSASTKYYWQIIVSDGKSETSGDIWDFSTVGDPIESKVPSTPYLVYPKNDMQSGNILFSWEEVKDDKGSENITYILNINETEYEITGAISKTINVVAGQCLWYVIAVDEDGNEAESEHIEITIM